MLYDESTTSLLRQWLVRTLQPICDADPEALADYVLALLKHDAAEPDLRKMFISQLEEFLEEEASKFVDTLFAALRSKSYLPYESVKLENSEGIPIPLDGLVSDRGRKRVLEADEHERPPPKGPKLSSDGSLSRFSPSGRHMPTNGRGHTRGEGLPNSFSHQDNSTYRPPTGFAGRGRRGICRDYHNNGFCARGSLCQYSHGDDAVVPPMLYANMIQGAPPFMPLYANSGPFMSNAPYDPHESRMEMGNSARVLRSKDALVSSTELPVIQDLTPQDPAEEAGKGEAFIQPNGFTHNFGTPRRMQHQMHMVPPNVPTMFPEEMVNMFSMGVPVPTLNDNPSLGPNQNIPPGATYNQGAKGSFPGESHRFPPRDDKTLVVEKIPDDKLSLEAVNDWFKRFGIVTNVAIDASSAKALVTFSNHSEAHAAWKSEEAIFGNRFVKVFWHRPLEGHGAIGQRALAASAPLLKTLGTGTSSQPHPQESSLPIKTPTPKVSGTSGAALTARQRALEQQISQQKVLISRLSAAKTPAEKQELMASLKKLQSNHSPPFVSVSPTDPSPNNATAKSLSEKDRLDRELELHAGQVSPQDQPSKEREKTAVLLERLSSLKAEATRIGVPDAEINADSYPTSPPHRPYRGRGGYRSRGLLARGRGGLPRGSMKLDNRPRRLFIQNIPSNEEAVQAVRAYYQNSGGLELFGKLEDGLVAQFWNRAAAESALASGSDIPSVGKVKISWHTSPTPSFTPVLPLPLPSQITDTDTRMDGGHADPKENYVENTLPDVEVEESGWGQSFDDEGESRRRRSRSRSFS